MQNIWTTYNLGQGAFCLFLADLVIANNVQTYSRSPLQVLMATRCNTSLEAGERGKNFPEDSCTFHLRLIHLDAHNFQTLIYNCGITPADYKLMLLFQIMLDVDVSKI